MRVTEVIVSLQPGGALRGGQELKAAVEGLPVGIPTRITFAPASKKERSNQQNNYYWGVVIEMLAEEGGYAPEDREGREEIHKLLKAKFLPEKKVQYKGDKRFSAKTRTESTTDLSPKEFAEFTEAIRRWAAQSLGINIPDPNATTQVLSPSP